MSAETEFKILQLCKGKTIAQVERRLRISEAYIAQKSLKTRCQLVGMKIGV